MLTNLLIVLFIYLFIYLFLVIYICFLDMKVKVREYLRTRLPSSVFIFLFDEFHCKRWIRLFNFILVLCYFYLSNLKFIWLASISPFIFVGIHFLFSLIACFTPSLNMIRCFFTFCTGTINMFIIWCGLLIEYNIIPNKQLYLFQLVNDDSIIEANCALYESCIFDFNFGYFHYIIYNVFGNTAMLQYGVYILLYFIYEFIFVNLLHHIFFVYHLFKNTMNIYFMDYVVLIYIRYTSCVFLSNLFSFFMCYVFVLGSLHIFILFRFNVYFIINVITFWFHLLLMYVVLIVQKCK